MLFTSSTTKLKVIFLSIAIGKFLSLNAFGTDTLILEPVTKIHKLHFETIHGSLAIDDPLAITLIQHPVMQRLKGIFQYGVMEKIDPSSLSYTRFDHSLGVYQILHNQGLGQKELIAGLLHDASHTVWSHSTEMLFGKNSIENYQDKIHQQFLMDHEIGCILESYGLQIKDVLPDCGEFLGLEQELPFLCADRIEYNIQAGFLTGLLSPLDIKEIHQSLFFNGRYWYFNNKVPAEKLALISIDQTLKNWSSPTNMVVSKWVCEALQILLDEGTLTYKGIHFNYQDDELWKILQKTTNDKVKVLMKKVLYASKYYNLTFDYDYDERFYFKSRALDPFVMIEGKLYRLTDLKDGYKQKFEEINSQAAHGWKVKYREQN